ncbi:RICIN domain-containing protein [Streptomyces sp. NPDC096310]|uniref:RICIN domain-containing protein n=1 Tax=Streptomyces sp. NPDC096310 TaxID=3366082 RepID=UPI0038290CB3
MRPRFPHHLRLLPALFAALGLVLLTSPGPAAADTSVTRLTNGYSNGCLQGQGEANTVASRCTGFLQDLEWVFSPVPGMPATHKYVKLSAFAAPGECLDNNGSRIYVLLCNGGPHQQWIVTRFQAAPPAGGEVGVRLKNVATGVCADTTLTNFSGWKIYPNSTCNDGAYQQWNITAAAAGGLAETYQGTASHAGMTWTVLNQRSDGVVQVGRDEDRSDPYTGDTPAAASLPVLCLRMDGRAAPAGIPTTGAHSWAKGEVRATPAVRGADLISRTVADTVCQAYFGDGWRMAEFHDGGGWSLWAAGTLPTGVRFWTAINDQNANPWN